MKQEQLFYLRGKRLEFSNPKLLKETALEIFDEKYNFPLVSGHLWDNGDFDGWKLKYLKPSEISDELTVRNFLEGLEKISLLDERSLEGFGGYISYEGVELRNQDFIGERLLTVGFNNFKERYSLDIKLDYGQNNGRENLLSNLAYVATTQLEKSSIQKIMGNYLGPNKLE